MIYFFYILFYVVCVFNNLNVLVIELDECFEGSVGGLFIINDKGVYSFECGFSLIWYFKIKVSLIVVFWGYVYKVYVKIFKIGGI